MVYSEPRVVASKPKYPQISQHTIRLVIGLIAFLLPILVSVLAGEVLTEVSAAYHQPGWGARDVFVGFLFAISAFLLAYNGCSMHELVWSKIAAVAALGVALFPCSCGQFEEIIPGVHFGSAGLMFIAIAVFCYQFWKRSWAKAKAGEARARLRATIYAVCGLVIVGSMIVIAGDYFLLDGMIKARFDRLVYWGESAALGAFGVAWLVASQILPVVTISDKRISLSPFTNRSECGDPTAPVPSQS